VAHTLNSEGDAMKPLRQVEREHIIETLVAVGFNKMRCARILQISVATLRNRLARYEQESQAALARAADAGAPTLARKDPDK
jgi:DNA-binding NtrC family response regulator